MQSSVAPVLGIQTPLGRERRSYRSRDCLIGETCFPGAMPSKEAERRWLGKLFGSIIKGLLKGSKSVGVKGLKQAAKMQMKQGLTEQQQELQPSS